jgi:ribonuclease P protein component
MRRGRRRAHRDIVIITTPRWKKSFKSNEMDDYLPVGSRLGITASRKVGNAVVRNRFKRRVREWFRSRRTEFESDLDLVVIARRSGSRLSFQELDDRLSRLLGLPAAGPSQN